MNTETIVDECPICLDDIDTTKNCIITECGHKFHCSCFMRHSAIQGFNCPYCRSITAEQVVEDNEDDYYDDEDDDEEEEEEAEIENNSFTFMGIRRMFAEAEAEAMDAEYVRQREREMEDEVVPSLQYMVTKLTAIGYTLEDFVRLLLVDYEASELMSDHYDRDEGKDYMMAFGDIAGIIEEYRNSMAYHQLNIEANS